MKLRYLLPLALLLFAAPAAAQTPLLPGQLIAFEIDPGVRQESPTSPNTVPRPEANIAFEYRIDGASTFVAAVKQVPCTVVGAGPTLTCRLRPPSLSAGTHTIEVRALTSPAEAGVNPSAFSTPLSVASIIVTAPGTPATVRVVSVP